MTLSMTLILRQPSEKFAGVNWIDFCPVTAKLNGPRQLGKVGNPLPDRLGRFNAIA